MKKAQIVVPKDDRETIPEGTIINSYRIIRLIGQGGYGDIYEVELQKNQSNYQDSKNIHNERKYRKMKRRTQEFAMKVEYVSSPKKALTLEKAILEDLQDCSFFPQINYSGIENNFHYIILELLGPSISNTRRQTKKHRFTEFTAIRLSFLMLKCIESFHKHGYVHCDIKPGNFLLRSTDPKSAEKENSTEPTDSELKPEARSSIVLIDYGLSRKYIDESSKMPFPERKQCCFVGTTKYASLNVHYGIDTSPRDDILSWLYSVVELINGKLPWSHITELKKIKKVKKSITPESLFETLPPAYLKIYYYASSLHYVDFPDYEMIYQLLYEAIINIAEPDSQPFDWESLSKDAIEQFSPIPTLPKASETNFYMLPPAQTKSLPNPSKCCILL